MFEFDEYKVYRGKDIVINHNFNVSIPTLSQIEDFGEREYFSAVHTLNASGADMKWQLWDYYNIDYTTISDYDLFLKLLYPTLSSKKYIAEAYKLYPDKFEMKFSDDDLDKMKVNPLELILKYNDNTPVDLADFGVYHIEDKNQTILYNEDRDATIDLFVYTLIVEAIRKIHGFKRNSETPANEMTKMDLIEDARDEAMAMRNKQYKSVLLPLVSTIRMKLGIMSDELYSTPISAFFYDIKRIAKIQDTNLLLQGAYSGFTSLKGIDKDRLDMFGDV